MPQPKPAHFLSAVSASFRYVEKSNPLCSNLQFLTYGVYELSGRVQSGSVSHATEEALLFCWQGEITVRIESTEYHLESYDVLYVPRGKTYHLSQAGGEGRVIVCRAAAEQSHGVFHSKWK